MNILKRTYAKVIDQVTIEEAPTILNGIVGYNNNASLCLSAGYKPADFVANQNGTWKTYTDTGTAIQESNFAYDDTTYKDRVITLIRASYSADDEAAILRKQLAGLDAVSFKTYNDFCEACKKQAKLEQIL